MKKIKICDYISLKHFCTEKKIKTKITELISVVYKEHPQINTGESTILFEK
jgi:hypothetical protein